MTKITSHKRNVMFTLFILLILMSLVYFISLLYFAFKPDEDVSMGLIQHNYFNLIKITSLDVHPPFYYLSLKFFTEITTFWTKSIFVKTIFARLFSVLCLILFLNIMIKIAKRLDMQINYKWQILLFLIVPGVINESTKIRMYSLGAFLIAIELYELIKFYQDKNNKNIILATLFALLAAYTFYPLAISAGLFLLLYFVLQLIERKRETIKTFFAGVILLILYIPWIPILINQMSLHSTTDGILAYNYFNSAITSITQLNAPSPQSSILKYVSLASLIIVSLFICVIKWSTKGSNKEFNVVLFITTINFILTLILSLIFSKRQFRTTITYPIFAVFVFLIISIVIIRYQSFDLFKNHQVFVVLSLVSLLMFMGYMSFATAFNVKSYDIPSVRLIKNMKHWKVSNNNSIDITKFPSIRKQNLISTAEANQDSIYLKSINKKAIIPNDKININDLARGTFNNGNSTELFKKSFNNIYFKNE